MCVARSCNHICSAAEAYTMAIDLSEQDNDDDDGLRREAQKIGRDSASPCLRFRIGLACSNSARFS